MPSNGKATSSGFILKITPARRELQEAIGAIKIYDGKSRLRLEASISNGVKRMAAAAKRRVPVDKGTLKKSIFSSFRKTTANGGPIGYFGAKAYHAHLVEMGVRETRVRPDKKKALRIIDSNAIRFAARAKIPSRAAHPFIVPAYEEERARLISDIKRAVKPK